MSKNKIIGKFRFTIILFLLLVINCISPVISAENNIQPDTKVDTSSLKVGDIVFCDMKETTIKFLEKRGRAPQGIPGDFNDHVLMYIGRNRFIESSQYIYRPLKKAYLGVVTTPAWFLNIWATNFMYGTVNTTQDKRNAAVEWAKSQRGTLYGKDGYSCGELVFHAYKNQGVRLYETWWGGSKVDTMFPWDLQLAYNVKMNIPNDPPIADFSCPSSGYVEQELEFSTQGKCKDPDGRIVNYTWDFGDGTKIYPYYHTDHKYDSKGTYSVTLTVCDNKGASTSITKNVTIDKDYNEYWGIDPYDDPNQENEPIYYKNRLRRPATYGGIIYLSLIAISILVIIAFIIWKKRNNVD
ncbi:MAG: PKD domain-containing protein [Thermoplasmatales archaeon]|nr:PKD domain-containing protein [Thermoplasmatales archaeon]